MLGLIVGPMCWLYSEEWTSAGPTLKELVAWYCLSWKSKMLLKGLMVALSTQVALFLYSSLVCTSNGIFFFFLRDRGHQSFKECP